MKWNSKKFNWNEESKEIIIQRQIFKRMCRSQIIMCDNQYVYIATCFDINVANSDESNKLLCSTGTI